MPGVKGKTRQMIEEATVAGVRALLNACDEHKIKKLVLTSDGLTAVGSHWKKDGIPYTEDDFAFGKNLSGVDGYINSKIMQEQECIEW